MPACLFSLFITISIDDKNEFVISINNVHGAGMPGFDFDYAKHAPEGRPASLPSVWVARAIELCARRVRGNVMKPTP